MTFFSTARIVSLAVLFCMFAVNGCRRELTGNSAVVLILDHDTIKPSSRGSSVFQLRMPKVAEGQKEAVLSNGPITRSISGVMHRGSEFVVTCHDGRRCLLQSFLINQRNLVAEVFIDSEISVTLDVMHGWSGYDVEWRDQVIGNFPVTAAPGQSTIRILSRGAARPLPHFDK